MTYHPDSVLVEKVAKALWEARDSLPWALAPQVQYRRDAEAVLSVACPIWVVAEALREIADQDWVENVLDPQWAARIAVAALSPVQGEHEERETDDPEREATCEVCSLPTTRPYVDAEEGIDLCAVCVNDLWNACLTTEWRSHAKVLAGPPTTNDPWLPGDEGRDRAIAEAHRMSRVGQYTEITLQSRRVTEAHDEDMLPDEPVQGEHHAQPEGENQMDDNNLNHLIAVNVLVPRLSVCEAERDEARKALAESQEREGSLNRCIDALEDRGVAREGELMALENVAVDLADARAQRDALAAAIEKHSKWAGECAAVYDCLRACRAALDWYAKEDRYDVGRASSRPVVLADRGLLARRALAALSPVQGEHEQDGDTA